MGYTIQIKRATSARWAELNPVLEEGEPGVELDTSKMKIGDGVATWDLLPYSSGGGSEFELQIANDTTLGGVKASTRTTETQEVTIDPETGRLYIPASGEIAASNVSVADIEGKFSGSNVEAVLLELFTFAGSGKIVISNAITGKGGIAFPTYSFVDLATAITNIPTGGDPGPTPEPEPNIKDDHPLFFEYVDGTATVQGLDGVSRCLYTEGGSMYIMDWKVALATSQTQGSTAVVEEVSLVFSDEVSTTTT